MCVGGGAWWIFQLSSSSIIASACEVRVKNAGVFNCDGRYFKAGDADGVMFYTQRTNGPDEYAVVRKRKK